MVLLLTWSFLLTFPLTAVAHSEIWPDPLQLPSSNRNSIVANLHRIHGLGEWFLYLEDDMFLNRPFDASFHVASDGRPISHMYSHMDKELSLLSPVEAEAKHGGWYGAGFTAITLLEQRLGLAKLLGLRGCYGQQHRRLVAGKRNGCIVRD